MLLQKLEKMRGIPIKVLVNQIFKGNFNTPLSIAQNKIISYSCKYLCLHLHDTAQEDKNLVGGS